MNDKESWVKTPRTDAVIKSDTGDSSFISNLVKLARELETELNKSRNISDALAYSIQNLGHYSDKAVKDYNSSLHNPNQGIPVHNIFTAYEKLLDTSS